MTHLVSYAQSPLFHIVCLPGIVLYLCILSVCQIYINSLPQKLFDSSFEESKRDSKPPVPKKAKLMDKGKAVFARLVYLVLHPFRLLFVKLHTPCCSAAHASAARRRRTP